MGVQVRKVFPVSMLMRVAFASETGLFWALIVAGEAS